MGNIKVGGGGRGEPISTLPVCKGLAVVLECGVSPVV